jgi:hypothetical protein
MNIFNTKTISFISLLTLGLVSLFVLGCGSDFNDEPTGQIDNQQTGNLTFRFLRAPQAAAQTTEVNSQSSDRLLIDPLADEMEIEIREFNESQSQPPICDSFFLEEIQKNDAFIDETFLDIRKECNSAKIDVFDENGTLIQRVFVPFTIVVGQTTVVDYSDAEEVDLGALPIEEPNTPNPTPPDNGTFNALSVTPNPTRLSFVTGSSEALIIAGQFTNGSLVFTPDEVAANATFGGGDSNVFSTSATGVVTSEPPGVNNQTVSTNTLTITYTLDGVAQQATIEVRTGVIVSNGAVPTVINAGSSSPALSVDFLDGNLTPVDVTNDPGLSYDVQPAGQGVTVDGTGSVTVAPGTPSGNFTLTASFDFASVVFTEETPVIVP